jgi:hypothetical protein
MGIINKQIRQKQMHVLYPTATVLLLGHIHNTTHVLFIVILVFSYLNLSSFTSFGPFYFPLYFLHSFYFQ